MRKAIVPLSILAASLMSYPATAQDEAAPPPEGAAPASDGAPTAAPAQERIPAPASAAVPAGYPDEYSLRPLTLAARTFQATLPVVLNLSKNAMLEPVWIPLDLRFGVSNELEVFVNHNPYGAGPLAFGGGVCIGGTKRGCEKFYNNVNLGGQFSLLRNNGFEVSGLLALEFRRISNPMYLAVDVGVGFKYVAAPISVKVTPQIGIGVNNRNGTIGTSGNTTTHTTPNAELIGMPLQVAFQAAPRIAIFLDSGIFVWIDGYQAILMYYPQPQSQGAVGSAPYVDYAVPVGVGGSFLAMHGLDVSIEFMLRSAWAHPSYYASDMTGFSDRTLMLYAAWRSK